MKIFLDMDGVIVDFMRGAHEFHKLNYNPYPYPKGEWEFVEHTGITPKEFWSPLSYRFWSTLPWMPDGRAIYDAVLDIHLLNDVAFLTTPTLEPGCVTGKIEWVRRHIPTMMMRTIITPAKEMCAHPNALLIDDADHNVDKWRDNGGVAILVPRIWNSRHAEAGSTVDILRKEISDAGIGSIL